MYTRKISINCKQKIYRYSKFYCNYQQPQYARQSAVYRTQGFIMQSGQKSENKVSSVTVQFSILYSWSGLIVQIMLVCDKQQQMKCNESWHSSTILCCCCYMSAALGHNFHTEYLTVTTNSDKWYLSNPLLFIHI